MTTFGTTLMIALAFGVLPGAADGLHRVPPEVLDAARRAGLVRVIVKIDERGGGRIDRAQDLVLAELAGTSARVLHRYLTSPFLALEVGEDALRILDRSPNVLSIAGDFELHPQSPGVRR